MLRQSNGAKKAINKKAPAKTNTLRAKRGLKTQAKPKRPTRMNKIGSARLMSTAAPHNGWAEGPKGVKRPISPSIQIWKFSPVAYMHVGSRIAGSVLVGGMTLAGLYGASIGCDVPAALDSIKINAPVLVPLLKMSIVFPLAYHGLSGARQIYQDFTAKGYDHEFQEQSSYAIAGATTLSTLYFGLGV